jgi:phosphate transport system substrate-binding protein
MKKLIKGVIASAFALSIALSGYGNHAKAANSGDTSDMVDWLAPAVPSVKKQTDAQDEYNKNFGRPLPTPEILQPVLDTALPSYQPRKDIELSGTFKGAASDVLADLGKRWIQEFQKYYPKVKIELPPPYVGSLGAKELIKGGLDFVLRGKGRMGF